MSEVNAMGQLWFTYKGISGEGTGSNGNKSKKDQEDKQVVVQEKWPPGNTKKIGFSIET